MVLRSPEELAISRAAASAAAVFPIPVGALARCAAPFCKVSIHAAIISA